MNLLRLTEGGQGVPSWMPGPRRSPRSRPYEVIAQICPVFGQSDDRRHSPRFWGHGTVVTRACLWHGRHVYMSGGNMKFGKLMGAAVTAAAMMIAAPVQAATYIITYTGHVSSGYDRTGVFGTPDRDLSGSAYTSKYFLTFPTLGAYYSSAVPAVLTYGGSQVGLPSPLTGSLTINGVTKSIAGNYFSKTYQTNGLPNPQYGYDVLYSDVEDYFYNGNYIIQYMVYNEIYSLNNDIISNADFTKKFSYNFQPGDSSLGGFMFANWTNSPNLINEYANGILNPDSYTISAVGAVPEPATWALMIVGFGAIGSAMRRRQRPRYAGLSLT